MRILGPLQYVQICECGCGQPTTLAKSTSFKHGYIKGRPCRFAENHHIRALCSGTNHVNWKERTLERFWDSTAYCGDCILWTRSLNTNGYGIFYGGLQRSVAHRWIYEQLHGPVPQGLELDHLCRNRACVNPNHLEVVTRQINVLRGIAGQRLREMCAKRTHCIHGHEYAQFGMISKRGWRVCRECVRLDALRKRHVANGTN